MTKRSNQNRTPPKGTWRNWGDHPVPVVIATIAGLITIIAHIESKSVFFQTWVNMSNKQTPIFLIFMASVVTVSLIIGLMVWRNFIQPLITEDTVPQVAEEGEILTFSNMQIHVTENGDVTLRTVVNSFLNGNRKPLKVLTPNDFFIVEKFGSESKQAVLLQAKPHNSPTQIVILIDVSGSMNESTSMLNGSGTPLSKVDVAKNAVLVFINDLINSDISSINGQPSYVAFLPFSSNGVYFLERTNGEIWFPTLPESRDEVVHAILSLSTDGQTPMYDAVSHAINVLQSSNDSRYKLIFCLTDGIDTSSNITLDNLTMKLRDSNIPVVSVGYGVDQGVNEAVLNSVSTASGAGNKNVGYFTNVAPQDLSQIFRGLLSDLNNIYEIRWKSSFPSPGSRVNATISATYVSVNGIKLTTSENREYVIPVAKQSP